MASGLQIGSALPLQQDGDIQLQPWLQYTPDGTSVVVSGDSGETWVLPTSLARLDAHACQVANRNFTRTEWARYVPGRPYQRVCPGLS